MQMFSAPHPWTLIRSSASRLALSAGVGVLVACTLSVAGGTPAVAGGTPAVAGGTPAVAGGTPAASSDPAWVWPLSAPPRPAVLGPFDPPAAPWEAGHRGVDLAAARGEPVLAAGAGRVLYAGMLAGRGVVSIDHGSTRTTYEPVTPSAQAGETVAAGDVIGVLGEAPSHCVPRTCLHWGLLDGEEYLHPLRLLGGGPIRLLPVWEAPAPYACPPGGCAGRGSRGSGGAPARSPHARGWAWP